MASPAASAAVAPSAACIAPSRPRVSRAARVSRVEGSARVVVPRAHRAEEGAVPADVAASLSRRDAVFVDADLLPVMERIAPELKTVKAFVVLADTVPQTTLDNVYAYEDLIAAGDADFAFEELPERTPAGMCYTSATTGMPKGVIYTHRDIYLHTLTECLPDVLNISEADTLLPVVPMFHANCWGLPFCAAWMGAKMVLPGERPHAPDVLDLIESEGATFCAAAVSIGIDMITELDRKRRDISCLRGLMLGGSATPAAVMEYYAEEFDVPVYTAWGSTELAPLATCVHIRRADRDKPLREQIPTRTRQGVACPGTELRLLDDDGLRAVGRQRELLLAHRHRPPHRRARLAVEERAQLGGRRRAVHRHGARLHQAGGAAELEHRLELAEEGEGRVVEAGAVALE